MSKEQFIINDQVHLSHRSSGSRTTDFIFSVDSFRHIVITLVWEWGGEKRHLEFKHDIMNCAVNHLIDWLQEHNPNEKKEQK